MLPHGLLRRFPMGLVPAVVSPRTSSMLDNLRIHQKFIAIPLLPPVLLGASAGGRIRSTVTEGVRAGRLNTLAIWRR
jgi:hypothetical protein